ncbi:MAG: saccharopine dehydrogenase NADP-binding domain-containing protein [Cyclobacteriaceae bacterium]|nr:saccharopine dehydrogenase NADP-binding domain-containing protein [Cyclobacteriaceae bacterium]
MTQILVLGAGRSATSLIDYLLANTQALQWELVVADKSLELAQQKVNGHTRGRAVAFDLNHENEVSRLIKEATLVISLLPARFHPTVGRICLQFGKSLLTASYVSPQMQELHEDVVSRGLLFLNECGLDPGLDHMTAMSALNKVRELPEAEIRSFISYTGGLMAPESEDNPWNYKFTWNPRNVVLAGKETAQFIRNGRYKYIPYHRLFTRLEKVQVEGYGEFEGYANRDSLKYRQLYGLQDVSTLIRGTLRRPGFCEAWNVFVQLGLTDDSYSLKDLSNMTYRDFINTFLYFHPHKSVEEKLCDYLNLPTTGDIMNKLKWLGIFENVPVALQQGSPADILQHILESKWYLGSQDKDMIVMQHQLGYLESGLETTLSMSLVSKGDDTQNTAMSKTVGWPLAIAAKLILTGKIQDTGVKVPLTEQYYAPILHELRHLGVQFIEKEL